MGVNEHRRERRVLDKGTGVFYHVRSEGHKELEHSILDIGWILV